MKLMYDELDVHHVTVPKVSLPMIMVLIADRECHVVCEPQPVDNWRLTVGYEDRVWLNGVIRRYKIVPNVSDEEDS